MKINSAASFENACKAYNQAANPGVLGAIRHQASSRGRFGLAAIEGAVEAVWGVVKTIFSGFMTLVKLMKPEQRAQFVANAQAVLASLKTTASGVVGAVINPSVGERLYRGQARPAAV